MAQISIPLTFTVRRLAPELIVPEKLTPQELKPLSDIDDQKALWCQVPIIHFYRGDPEKRNKNPASVIREALAKVLVFYYPFAGRLKEGPTGKLMVNCSGEGVLFIEAEADVTLKQFGDVLHPSFPCMEELLYDVPGSSGILDSPLLLIQVTRLLCGGFIFAIRYNHTMTDGRGITQFLTAVGEIARGALEPSMLPVWQREFLSARNPPRVTCSHHEYDDMTDTKTTIISNDEMEQRSFFFGPIEVSALRRFVPIHLQNCSTFDVLTASIWRCRTIALQPNPEDEMRVTCVVDARSKFNPPIPLGYYGAVLAFPVAISTAHDLCNKPIGHIMELVSKAKSNVTEEYMRSIADLMVIKGRPPFTTVRNFVISDVTRVRLNVVDFGWGKPAYASAANGGGGNIPGLASYYIPSQNNKGESGIIVPICLPSAAMNKFVKELNNMLLQDNNINHILQEQQKLLASSKL
ncbi:benzyl alcohol O-benzoyltransferase [Artemisia annua]|uniref:Benzyl alcohol O-benzoyltransferase n=1 Tax=Artemisia annua TaxID=35608 RepID=A0A2U1PX45_ARTAN|nr:benzyl alcohol O-benzoyltransferase [Artemisia annua]